MNEVKEQPKQELSSDINIITAEINAYKQVAGEAIFEIGRRLKHVKENDLVHGEFKKWVEVSAGIPYRQANRFMKVTDELSDSNMTTSSLLGLNVLYEIATLPPEERDKPHTTSKGETKTPAEMTVRELRQLKADLKRAEEQRKQAQQQAELERKERERLEALAEEYATREPEVRTEYVEPPELRDRSFDTPYGVKLLDDFYNAMDELSEWQRKYAWITSDIEQLRALAEADEDMRDEFEKNRNMWRTLSEIFDGGRNSGIIDAEIIEVN
ncbi:DUF3102 domain-containing protein [Virgibacillus proomii]|uniref:DUF3102 domain-containing protein n=1 Tax=Virgibacillus proomii TaxID=84407 RepID=UPI0020A03C7F|nr:DUF3102 domain-containing protein [Virgibacillus proomii]